MTKEPVELKVGGYEEHDAKSQIQKLSKDKIGKIYAIVSGKGGVGKSLVSSLLADAANKSGRRTALIDADITGPSIPKIFGLSGNAQNTENGVIPVSSKGGVRIMSINLLLETEDTPVVWRGPILGGVVKQFFEEVYWGDIDAMFIDMPPGTGDVPLTVFQSLPIDGIILVTSPQGLSNMIVAKAINMANMMDVPVMGIIENMSEFVCPDTGKAYKIFGESHIDETALKYSMPVIAKLPIYMGLSKLCDEGKLEDVEENPLTPFIESLLS